MTNENVCKFHKFGFCRKKKDCTDYHPIEVCEKKVCDLSKCAKRHPQACRYFEAGNCRFGDFCHYDHRKQNNEKLLERMRKLENEIKRVTDINEKQVHNKERIKKLENENKRITELNGKQADTILNLHKRMSHLEKEYVSLLKNLVNEQQEEIIEADIQLDEDTLVSYDSNQQIEGKVND